MRRGTAVLVWLLACSSGCLFKKVFQTPDSGVESDASVAMDLSGVDGDFAVPQPDLTTIACTTNAECTQAQPICRANVCSPCLASEECATEATKMRCDTVAASPHFGECVACLDNSQCPTANAPICSLDRTCLGCQAHAECSTGACKPDGACATENEISHVDNGGMNVFTCQAGPPRDGSRDNPYCDFAEAIAASTRKWLVVTGHAGFPYGSVTVSLGSVAQDIVVIGPGRDAAEPVQILPSGAYAVAASGNTAVELHGVVLGTTQNNSTSDLVNCFSAKVSIYDSRLHRAGNAAVRGNGCNLILERNELRRSVGNLLTLVGGEATVLNNLFDQSGDVAIRFQSDTTNVQFRFNTVTRSGFGAVGGDQGGAHCEDGAMQAIESSLFFGNNHEDNGPNTGRQFQDCVLANVVTENEVATPGVSVMPMTFVDSANGNFHLVANDAANLACCVDKAVHTTERDIDKEARPQGAGRDIGADEVQ